jgi:hypothetical protein
MRPEEARALGAQADEVGAGAILDADLLRIDADLRAAGRHASLSLRSRTQPTRWFAIGLRAQVVDGWRERIDDTPAEGDLAQEGPRATPR